MSVPPASFPRGWFLIEWSDQLAPGQARPLRYFGRDLVLFRTEQGHARLADAHCPHLGAHLGHGGEVKGEQLQCPFHKWRFDSAGGGCAAIPFTQRSPRVGLTMWHVHEHEGMILAWYHDQGAPPSWDFPDYPHLGQAEWLPWEGVEWRIKSHVYEITENDVDCAHMPAVHDFCEDVPATEAVVDGALMHVTMLTEVTLSTFGMKGHILAPAQTTKVGLGMLLVSQTIEQHGRTIDFRTIGTFTPIDEDHVHIRARHTVKRMDIPGLAWFVMRNYCKTFKATVEQDIPIWENKVYRQRPPLSEADGPILRFRAWAQQFYPGGEALIDEDQQAEAG